MVAAETQATKPTNYAHGHKVESRDGLDGVRHCKAKGVQGKERRLQRIMATSAASKLIFMKKVSNLHLYKQEFALGVPESQGSPTSFQVGFPWTTGYGAGAFSGR